MKCDFLFHLQAPEPIGKWEKELKATEQRPVCIQRSTFGRSETIDGSEDCLYLNIYTPFSVNIPWNSIFFRTKLILSQEIDFITNTIINFLHITA